MREVLYTPVNIFTQVVVNNLASKKKLSNSKKKSYKKKIKKKIADVKSSSSTTPVISGVGIGVIAGIISRYALDIKIGVEDWKNLSVLTPLSLCGVAVAGAIVTDKKSGLFWASLAITSGVFAWLNLQNVKKTLKLQQMKIHNLRSNLRNQKQQLQRQQPQDGWGKMKEDLAKGNSWSRGDMNTKLMNGFYSDGKADSDQRTYVSKDNYPMGKLPFKRERPVRQTITSLSNPRKLVENVDVIP